MAWGDALRERGIVAAESDDDLGQIREQAPRLFVRRGGNDVDVARGRRNQ